MVRITKDVLRQLNTAVGKLDSDSGRVFSCFIGRFHMSDLLFHGELHFADVGEDPPKDTVSIQAILSPDSSAKPVKPAKSAKRGETTDMEK
ncbi:hypothetical protein LCGC14_1159240 [marine sediment metagenome]|uniref:Uncharacterized protein n=1 Tax=marine sediment metagenome TaxID=412755 RepID=A0A0F9PBI8_9ZZZZ